MPQQPLAVTPSPAKGEALLSFILKTSALNGYTSPSKLFSYAEMTDNEARSVRPPLSKLAPLYGKTAEELIALGLDYVDEATPVRHLPLMGHAIPFMYTRSKNAGFCLQCVQEHGFIEGFHELKYALACPQHHCKTILTCPSCHNPLNWHRRNLMTCSCGADLSVLPLQKVEHPAVLVLLGVIHAKLMRESLPLDEMKALGFPIEAIDRLSIQTLLSMIYRFGLFNQKQQSADNELETDWQALQTTAEVLSGWPHRFHDYLDQVHAPNANLKVSGLRGQFNSFYESFFKNITQDQEIQFMREAFIGFGQERWKQAAIHPVFVTNVSSNVVGINGLAKAINMQPSTAKKMVEKGLIKVQNSVPAHGRVLFDLSEQQRFEFAQGQSLSVKSAANLLDIPVDVLRAYRARGYYQARYLAVPIVLYHEHDVKNLRDDLMRDCKPCKVFINNQHITLAQIMRMKTSAEIKATLIAAVRARNFIPVGALSDKPSGLVFDQRLVKVYLHNITNMLKGGVSIHDAQSKLEVDREVLFSLVKAGILQCQYNGDEMRVLEASLGAFCDQFISCKQVAHLKATTQKSIISLCHALGIGLYQIPQANLFSQNVMWVEKKSLSLLGIHSREVRYANVA